MNIVKTIGSTIKNKLGNSSTFTRNLGWMGVAQAFIRVSRLGATFILPRFLTPHDFGLAALVLTTYEYSQTVTRIGVHSRIIQAEADELEDICNSAYWLNWVLFGSLFVCQCIAAFPVAWFYKDNQLILPICLLAFNFLIAPLGAVQSALIQRDNRIQITATARAIRYATANILTAVFAVLHMGMWAIILPILIASPIEFITYLFKHPWRKTGSFTTKYWGKIFSFGINFLGIELLKTLRETLDYLIIGRFIGIDLLGVYYFAYNAGLGISLTIVQSITTALYPALCEVRTNLSKFKQTYFNSLKTIGKVIVGFVALQSILVPLYIPIMVGEKIHTDGWSMVVPIVILVCLSAIPRPFDIAGFQLLAAIDKPQIGLLWNVLFTMIFSCSLLIAVKWGIITVAVSVLLVHALLIPLFVVWSARYVFGKPETSPVTLEHTLLQSHTILQSHDETDTDQFYVSQWTLSLASSGTFPNTQVYEFRDADSNNSNNSNSSAGLSDRIDDPRKHLKLIAESVTVLEEAAKQLNISVDSLDKPSIQLIDNSTMMVFEISGVTPEEAQRRAFAINQAFNTRLEQLRKQEIAQQEKTIPVYIKSAENDLEKAQQRLAEKTANIGLPLNQLLETIEALRRKKIELRRKKIELLAELVSTQSDHSHSTNPQMMNPVHHQPQASLFQDYPPLEIDDIKPQLQGSEDKARDLEFQISQLEVKLSKMSQDALTLEILERDLRIAQTVYSSVLSQWKIVKSDSSIMYYPQLQLVAGPTLPTRSQMPDNLVQLGKKL
ncbi:oligosaccharide flippase family protein [Moorena sp. SIO3I8]|uniref:oligosaccharide flippase family protein n=1 Tax=Moorena sp. SIO3I8 TaxID=2607833 RepID=UPI0013C0D825|nr:oligosaccharide flippase family protein [Moorena sp. SIO3I8]NEO06340.1 oligosaccharide flippase family protein [Moorena sp. SIO3I8]